MAAARHKDMAKIVAGDVKYLTGFGNGFETEALPGALPIGRNSPQTLRLRPLRRATLGLAVHRAARLATSARGSIASGRR